MTDQLQIDLLDDLTPLAFRCWCDTGRLELQGREGIFLIYRCASCDAEAAHPSPEREPADG